MRHKHILALLLVGSLAGCGGDHPHSQDGAVLDAATDARLTDSGAHDSAIDSSMQSQDSGFDSGSIDAGVDSGPTCAFTMCGATCVDTTTSVDHCGTCPVACTAGQACLSNACGCPGNFLPASRTSDPADLVFAGAAANDVLAVASISNAQGLHGLLVSFNSVSTNQNQAYTLTNSGASSIPYVFATFRASMPNTNTDANFVATAGSLTFTKRCAGGVAGTLTSATFSAVQSDSDPTLVVGGCTFSVPSMTFAIGATCP